MYSWSVGKFAKRLRLQCLDDDDVVVSCFPAPKYATDKIVEDRCTTTALDRSMLYSYLLQRT